MKGTQNIDLQEFIQLAIKKTEDVMAYYEAVEGKDHYHIDGLETLHLILTDFKNRLRFLNQDLRVELKPKGNGN